MHFLVDLFLIFNSHPNPFQTKHVSHNICANFTIYSAEMWFPYASATKIPELKEIRVETM